MLIRDILKEAYRESNLIAIGQSMSAMQETEALSLFNRTLSSVFGNEMGDPLTSLFAGENNVTDKSSGEFFTDGSTVKEDVRIFCNLSSPLSVVLPLNPGDGCRFSIVDNSNNLATYPVTVSGNGNKIAGSVTTVINTDGAKSDFFFREDAGEWYQVSPLTSSDEFPFPEEFEDFFILSLALRLNPRNDVAFKQESVSAWANNRKRFRSRYNKPRTISPDNYYLNLSNNSVFTVNWSG